MKTFCVVDDDEIFKLLLNKGLSILGYTEPFLDFDNGKDALDYFESLDPPRNIPDVIFLDINMDAMDGWDFLLGFYKIRTRQKKQIEIYMMSSSSMRKDIEKASSLHVTDYLIKPVSIDILRSILQP